VWIELRVAPPAGAPRPGLFLDRDGIIVEDCEYLSDPRRAALVPGAAALIAAANQARVPVAVVTNQSGIDQGLYGWTEFAAVEAEIARLLALGGARVDAVAACPFHPVATAGFGDEQANWRKPGPRMITALSARLRIDSTRSWLVGDRGRDVAAARAAGLAGALIMTSVTAEQGEAACEAAGSFAVQPVATLAEAARFLAQRRLIEVQA
jgi:D-glycero-D-manno-heptose 1,7-bisphosphate phosphatase